MSGSEVGVSLPYYARSAPPVATDLPVTIAFACHSGDPSASALCHRGNGNWGARVMAGGKTDYDLIIAGGGLAGSALAIVMARSGHRVLVVERETRFRDRIRGEMLQHGAAAKRSG
jgi:NADPH-dependent 2,4-dienoyl-CoA reductase/sulfur reductase-like enzyme